MAQQRQFFIDLSVESNERFDISKFMEFTDNFDPLTPNFFSAVERLPERQKFFVQSEEGRPDLISFKIYGDVQFWWVIMIYNNIVDVDDLNIGRILSIPDIDSLEDLFFSLKSKETAS